LIQTFILFLLKGSSGLCLVWSNNGEIIVESVYIEVYI